MTKIFLFTILLLPAIETGYAQMVTYTYDAAGNRTIRQYSSVICPPEDQAEFKTSGDISSASAENSIFPQEALEEKMDDKDIKTGKDAIKIYVTPNPSNGQLHIEGLAYNIQNIITIYNALGEAVYILPLTSHLSPVTIDLSMQPKGIYMVKIISGEDVFVERIAVQ